MELWTKGVNFFLTIRISTGTKTNNHHSDRLQRLPGRRASVTVNRVSTGPGILEKSWNLK